jgi:hypothetical protein
MVAMDDLRQLFQRKGGYARAVMSGNNPTIWYYNSPEKAFWLIEENKTFI